MVTPAVQLYRFDEFQLDAVKRVLLRDEKPVHLPSRALDVLLALVEHSQSVIDKDELMRLVWGERVVEENNLTRQISTLRKVFDGSPNDHRYIVTVPGRGYSFVAGVERVPTNGADENEAPALEVRTDRSAKPNGFERMARLSAIEASTPASQPRSVVPMIGRSRLGLWAAVLVLLLASAGVVIFKVFPTSTKPAALNSYRDWEMVKLTRTGDSIYPAISPDGKYVAYVNKGPGRESIWIHQLATSTQQQLVPPEKFDYFDLLFSPDGSELYFARVESSTPLRSLYRMPALGGVAKKLRDDVDSTISLSRDGARLCFTRRNFQGKHEFVVANADGVEERVLAERSLEYPAWSPDGNVIAFSVGNAGSGGEDMGIHELRLSDGATREISAKKWNHVSFKSWLPDGSGLIVCGRDQKVNVYQIWFVAYPSGDVRPLSNDLDNLKNIRLTEDARMLVTEQIDSVSDIWIGPLADAASAKKIGVGGRSDLCFVADARIMYSSVQSQEATKIWVMNLDGTDRKQLTTDSGNDVSAVASPGGRLIVFASSRTGYSEIWRMNTNGSNLVQLTDSKGANFPGISPDGRWVIYLTASDNKLRKVPIEGGRSVELVSGVVGASAVSPDGKLIAYFAAGKNAWGIAVNSFLDGSPIERFEVGSHSLNNAALKWTPDGKAFLYSVSYDGVANIWMQPLGGNRARQVTDFKSDGIFRFDISSDGKNLICARGGWKRDIVLIKNLR